MADLRSSPESSQVTLNALGVALQHPSFADIKVVCKVAQVCRSWRTVVQQSTARNVHVDFIAACGGTPDLWGQLDRMSSLAAWLPKNAGLVGSLAVAIDNAGSAVILPEFCTAVDSMLGLALQQAANPAVTTGRLPAVRVLQLSNYSCINFAGPAVLAALPAACLTALNMDVSYSSSTARNLSALKAGLTTSLTRLSQLRDLKLDFCHHRQLGGAGLTAVSMLTQLTTMQLRPVEATPSVSASLQQLPVQLQRLELAIASEHGAITEFELNLAQLTVLRHLCLSMLHGRFQDGSALPPQVTSLELRTKPYLPITSPPKALEVLGVYDLQQLQFLELDSAWETAEELRQLAKMQQLNELRLGYQTWEQARRAAAAWSHIPQLRCITYQTGTEYDYDAPADCVELLYGISGATGLTELNLNMRLTETEYGCQFFEHLKGLTNLQHLHVDGFQIDDVCRGRDAMHLTTLTRLTHLSFGCGCPSGVEDMTGAALALHLTNLEYLDLSNCGLETMALLPVVAGRLTKLEVLLLSDNGWYTAEYVMMLTTLKRLTKSDLGSDYRDLEPLQDLLSRFWAIIRA